MDVLFSIPECVIKPERSDKPHRKLPIEVAVNTDYPHYMEMRVRDGETIVFEADLYLSDVKAIVQFLDEAYYINRREENKSSRPEEKDLDAAKQEALDKISKLDQELGLT
jgi:hypothetical protein